MTPETDSTVTSLRGSAYPAPVRALTGVLVLVSRLSLPVILALLLLDSEGQLTPPRLVRAVLYWSLLPGLAAWLLQRAFAVTIEAGAGKVAVTGRGLYRRGRRVELPACELAGAKAWRLPLPGPGLTARGAGEVGLCLQADALQPLLATLAPGSPEHTSPAALHGQARHDQGRPGPLRRLLKYGVFPLLPTFVFFRLHQFIMFGGLLGQYYLEGLQPYLSSLVFHWVMALVYLLLYAGLLRVLAETAALVGTWLAPARATGLRRWAERAVALLYYGGVPVMMALMFLR